MLSIEITTKCPLHCPGCYAYEDAHLGDERSLRDLDDRRGDELIGSVLELVDRLRPLHLSIVGGDPLVRYRELECLLPQLVDRKIAVQLVTSAFRPIPSSWKKLPGLYVVVSIDGLPAEHNARRAPATYDRILTNIAGQRITVHCTITGQMMKRSGYLKEFLDFWTSRAEVVRVWFSLFTPQTGDHRPEILDREQRQRAIADLLTLRRDFPKLEMSEATIRQFAAPPRSPRECVFARATETISADLRTKILPCQFGGNPDCSSCGCIASMGLAALAERRLAGVLPVGTLFNCSLAVGKLLRKPVDTASSSDELHVLP